MKKNFDKAYESYKYRLISKGKPYMSKFEFIQSRIYGEKKKDGQFKPDWNKPNKRLPLIWLTKYQTVDQLLNKQMELIEKIRTIPKRRSQYTQQLDKVNLALDLIRKE